MSRTLRTAQRAGWVGLAFALMSVTLLVLWATGLVMVGLPASELMEMSELEVAVRRASGILHGVMTWVLCVACGRGVWPHIQLMFRRSRDSSQWVWGVVNLAVIVVLALGGLVLLYGSPDWHTWMACTHTWLGICAPLPYVRHVWTRWRAQGLL